MKRCPRHCWFAAKHRDDEAWIVLCRGAACGLCEENIIIIKIKKLKNKKRAGARKDVNSER